MDFDIASTSGNVPAAAPSAAPCKVPSAATGCSCGCRAEGIIVHTGAATAHSGLVFCQGRP